VGISIGRAGFAVALMAAGATTLACGDAPRPGAPDPAASFVLVVVDTLRADRLHFAGYSKDHSPSFDALRGDSIWFPNAYSTSSWTLPATASLFTSQLVSEHGVAHWGSRLLPEHITLVEELRRAGYRTGMWTANRIVAGERGFADRFEHYEFIEHPDYRGGPPLTEAAFGSAEAVVARALAWIRDGAGAGGAPFFAYLHFMEPHAPYLCPPDTDTSCRERSVALNGKVISLQWNLSLEERRQIEAWYDADVARMDAALAELLAGLRAAGLLESSWVVLLADHGEMLGEWNMYMHGRTLYEPMVRVPLLFRPPGGGAGRVDDPVSLVDVAPTLLGLAGIAAPPSFSGRNLGPALQGGSISPRPVVSELFQVGAGADGRQKHYLAVTHGDRKFLVRTDGVLERFDLRSDAGENRALPADRREFEALLDAAGARFDLEAYSSGDHPAPTPEMREQLEALGYLH
jgi:arylsulfatase A-like enzyme